MNWISVEDEVPTDDEEVLICYQERCLTCFELSRDSRIAAGYYQEGGDEWLLMPPLNNSCYPSYKIIVTHWMPLPDLPDDINNQKGK